MSTTLIHASPTLQRAFRCVVCDQIDLYGSFTAEPVHCARPMEGLEHFHVGGDPDEIRLAVLQVGHGRTEGGFATTDKPIPDHWTDAYEFWRFQPGREGGERIGWLGATALAWEWFMVPGCKTKHGVALSKDEALAGMWSAINEG